MAGGTEPIVSSLQSASSEAVVGLVPPAHDAQTIESAIEGIVQSTLPGQIAIVHPPFSATQSDLLKLRPDWQLIENDHLAQDPAALAESLGESFRTIFEIAQKLGARACVVVASAPAGSTADWIPLLLQPVLDGQFDLVAPCYARHRFEGMINRAIVYPLVRALYGVQIRNPMGPDFGVSRRLLDRLVTTRGTRAHTLPSVAAEAVSSGMSICQAHLGARIYSLPDWTNLSSLLAQVLGPLFLDVERYAAHWQRSRGLQPIREFGKPASVAGPDSAVDVSRLVESFQLGARNLQDVWSVILPPSTLVELRRMALNGAAAFRMPDATWAHVVYDFALAYRLRAISRDQMLRALTPIYLGWVASYARELENHSSEAVEQRLEKLCVAFEETKSYFVSRWRWPDRFNP